MRPARDAQRTTALASRLRPCSKSASHIGTWLGARLQLQLDANLLTMIYRSRLVVAVVVILCRAGRAGRRCLPVPWSALVLGPCLLCVLCATLVHVSLCRAGRWAHRSLQPAKSRVLSRG